MANHHCSRMTSLGERQNIDTFQAACDKAIDMQSSAAVSLVV